MPYDGNGNYTLPPVYKATPGTEIITTQHNTPLEDIQAALNAVLLRNGSAPITGNWNMGTNRITFLADGVANTDAANVGQLKALLNNTALTGVPTVPAVTDWTAYQPVGAKDADARYAILNQNNAGSLSITGSFTAQQADLRYLSLTEGTVTGQVLFSGNVTHSGNETFNGTITVPDVSDFTSNQALSAKAADGRYMQLTNSNGQTVSGPVAFGGKTIVPNPPSFTGGDALNAISAEGRYVKSIPIAGSGNIRITDLWENSDGRAVFGDGTKAPILANLADLPFSDTGLKEQAFMQWTTLDQYGHGIFTFPTAFRAGTVPVVTLMIDCEPAGTYAGHTRTYSFVRNGTAPSISNTGFMLAVGVTDGSGVYVSTVPVIACVRAVGYF
ncbi:hypothetical protein NKW44_09120 [Acetobacter lovaniensis]|uniref:hypothetical protein n=1 Tax=Acetobacter lovaniensis TaxID=104100 RepID=UPI00209F9ED1|nr:hypothetical protein [Acetobacter lovaniensis]MCP1239854.1 hypothetical protein [Acetobacter lovaniensis]